MTNLPQSLINDLTDLRHALHRVPDLSGGEGATAARIETELRQCGADQIWTGLGGHGVAAEFTGLMPGPTVLFRCELDGLPIPEISDLPYRSEIPDKGHLCGHDGHMATLIGLAKTLTKRPVRGRVILLFQPAEETGAGAAAVIADPQWADIRPDYAFAYHNVPGRPLGEIGLRAGDANCASRGMQIDLHGKSAHAAQPQNGLSPASAMASLMTALPDLSHGTIDDPQFTMATLTHAQLGAPSFGIAPGTGRLHVTLRSRGNAQMSDLTARALALINAHKGAVVTDITWHDVFHAVTNDPYATEIAGQMAQKIGYPTYPMAAPYSWSEDFGRFGEDGAKSTLLYVGAGEAHPQLHNPDYDFPDALLPIMVRLFRAIMDHLLTD